MSLEGSQLGHYRLTRQIGSGGMGEIYLAEDTRIARQVAVKVVRNEPASYPDAATTQESTRLFRREMKAIASLDNPHILTLLDFGEETINRAVITYMVMPYRPEGSLNDWLSQRTEKLSLEEIDDIIRQAADALHHAHDNGIIHQDVKPSNFLVRSKKARPNQPDLLLADFGIAKLLGATSTASQSSRGTATYMPPEQWEGHPVPATDQYALAIMAYQLLTGRPPFQGRLEQVMHQHLMIQPHAPSKLNSHLPAAIDSVILVALAKKPEERFASISAFSNAFHNACSDTQPAQKAAPQKGSDIYMTLSISTKSATTGTSRMLTLADGRTVTATIPSGVKDGQVLRLDGLGSPGTTGGQMGALLLTLEVKPDKASPPPIKGRDTRSTLILTPEEAKKGTIRRVTLPNGKLVDVTVPPGAYNGQEILLYGRGEPGFNGGRSGTFIVTVMVEASSHTISMQKPEGSKVISYFFISVAIALVIVILIVSALNIFMNTESRNTLSNPSGTPVSTSNQTLDTYCTAIASGSYDTAYNQFSTNYRRAYTLSDFTNVVPLQGCTYTNVHATNDGNESATLYFSSGTSGSPETQTVTLVQENGTWKIDTVTNS